MYIPTRQVLVYITICLYFSALPPQLSPARSMAVTSSQLKNSDNNPTTKNREIESKSKSPYTFFTVDSDDDFDPYGSDVPSDVETKRDLLLSHSLGIVIYWKFGDKKKSWIWIIFLHFMIFRNLIFHWFFPKKIFFLWNSTSRNFLPPPLLWNLFLSFQKTKMWILIEVLVAYRPLPQLYQCLCVGFVSCQEWNLQTLWFLLVDA